MADSNSSEKWHTQLMQSTYSWPRSSKLLLVAILLLASLLYIMRYQTAVQTGVTGDDARYIVLAESFLKGQPYRVISYPDPPLETVWPPGYSLIILAPAGLFLGVNPETLRLTSVALASLNVLLFYFLLKSYLDDRWSLIIVTSLFAFNHWIAGLASMAMSETGYLTFVLLTMLLLQQWWERAVKGWRGTIILLIAGLTQAAAMLIRYQGIALGIATALWLLLHKKWRPMLFLAAITTLAVLPFLLFMAGNLDSSDGSLFAIGMISGQITTLWTRLPATFVKYASTIPLVMIPLLGPRVLAQAQGIGLGWLPGIFHLAIFALVAIGVMQGLIKRELLAVYAVTYLGIIILVDNQGGIYTNESRYAAMLLPAAYLYLWRALAWITSLWQLPGTSTRIAGTLISVGLITILIGRNYQQARITFPVTDLSAGAYWVQANTDPQAIIMTHDPVERYIYLQRRTIPIPAPQSDLFLSMDAAPDFILIAPPLRLPDSTANITMQLDQHDKNTLLPFLNENGQQFERVWEDSITKTSIFRILK